MKITQITLSNSYTLDQMNSGYAYKDGMLKKIDSFIASNQKGIGTSWECGAVKRFVESELQGLTKAKQIGGYASAKIAVGKAETFDALRKAFDKLKVD